MTLRPSLAVIAHDGKKTDLVAYATYNRAVLAQFDLFATATTGRLLHEKVGLKVTTMLSGPLGGDAQIAAMVAEGRIRAVLFFVDPLSAHPHDPDIRTLLRVCNVHNIPIATTLAAADLFLTSPLLYVGMGEDADVLEAGTAVLEVGAAQPRGPVAPTP